MSSGRRSWRGFSRAPAATLALPTFRLLASLVTSHAGIALSDDLLPKVERRLRGRLFAVGAHTFEEYYRHLKYRDAGQREISSAVELLTVHETYFFRELNQLQVFRDSILPEIRRRKSSVAQQSLRIWCAGCSTGEEMYSIAILVANSHLFDSWDVQVIGTDLSRRAIDAAREGLYSESSFRAMPPEYRRFFESIGNDQFRVRERYRDHCRFLPHNLLQVRNEPFLLNVDVIFCRNVLIYFDLPTRQKIVESFYRSLRPGGYLLLGHSESLLNTSEAFQIDSFQDALTYRRPLLQASSSPPDHRRRGDRDSW